MHSARDKGTCFSGFVIVEAISPTLLVLSVDDVGRIQDYVAPTKTVFPQIHFFKLIGLCRGDFRCADFTTKFNGIVHR